ncbi:MAG: ATP-binding cassette domain-containing protein [Coriobacteriia bacterium]|nr:ATP-binding cassette domain-containing protein [Coriobacteriia bacterium]
MSKPLIQVSELRKYFNVREDGKRATLKAVDGVTFDIAERETLGLVGESGCGKTTTGLLILNLIKPTGGEVLFEGSSVFDPKNKKNIRRNMQIIFQDPYASLNPRLRVADIVGEPLVIHGLAKGLAIDARVKQLLGYVGLSAHQANRFPHEFSGGQRQRIGIARALAVEPRFIVCDEPVSALDVSVQSQVLNLLKDLQDELDLTYLFIAHGLNVIKHVSDRVGVMYLGTVVEMANASDIYLKPLHPYTKALMSAIPIPDPSVTRERVLLEGSVPSPIDPPAGCVFSARCPKATDQCFAARPLYHEYLPDHWVACFHV